MARSVVGGRKISIDGITGRQPPYVTIVTHTVTDEITKGNVASFKMRNRSLKRSVAGSITLPLLALDSPPPLEIRLDLEPDS